MQTRPHLMLVCFGVNFFSSPSTANAFDCKLPTSFSIEADRGRGWDIKDSEAWFVPPIRISEEMFRYRALFQGFERRSQKEVIQDHRKVVADALQRASDPRIIALNRSYLANINFVLSEKLSHVRPLSCLEWAFFLDLFESGENRNVPLDREYQWYVLGKGGDLKVLRSIPGEATTISALWLSFEVSKWTSQGWRVLIDLHNHPRLANHLVPSLNDRDAWEMNFYKWKMEAAVISNGFETIEYTPADANRLHERRD